MTEQAAHAARFHFRVERRERREVAWLEGKIADNKSRAMLGCLS